METIVTKCSDSYKQASTVGERGRTEKEKEKGLVSYLWYCLK
jgi:hypothetical protein